MVTGEITVGPLDDDDRGDWEVLFRAYIEFYDDLLPQAAYDRAWAEFRSDVRMHAFGAWQGGRLVGIAHFFVHPDTWGPDVCYLQDLFTAPDARGQGVGRALIAEVGEWARVEGCAHVYWQTRNDNEAARGLYDKVATFEGFLVYRMPL
ncbi:GNAT family acetyltransferase [Humibacillus sp. DSM 29435]|uniref:GNAT family N-acetyltransferase n=1 Tax=Humibacillus sp. DSM 29435 TaxID=1869167 RepID=UPI0008725BE3|nr:GNAT family N-acetyltransferase [Humibacillus sp. DSM 29435]OFE18822.1 GNAT family acetyltransferase [Humibacillus sp. DSM 29435]